MVWNQHLHQPNRILVKSPWWSDMSTVSLCLWSMLCYSLRDNRTSTIQDNSFLLHGFYFDSSILIIIFVDPYWYLKSMLQKTTTDIPCIIALCKYCKFVAILLCQKMVSIFDSNKVFLFIFCNARDPHPIPGLGQSLEEDMATPSSTLSWGIPWTEEPCRLHTVHGVTKSGTQLCNYHTQSIFKLGYIHCLFRCNIQLTTV